MPPCTSFDERLEVPADQSRASTRPTDRPRVTASSADPVPTIPPPTTRMSSSRSRIAAIAALRCFGPSPLAPVGATGATSSADLTGLFVAMARASSRS